MDSIFDLDHLYRTYFKMALPSVFGLMVSVVYNLADTFFIAQSNDTALIAGVSLCAPVFTALMAFGNIYGQGGSSLISRLLGQDDREGTGRVSSFCFYVALTTGVVLAALMMLFRVPLLGILGATAETMPHAQAYYTVLAIGAPATVLNFIHSNLVRCEGMATQSMIGSIGGTVINIILDPILIFGLGWGVRGAAVATVLSQAVGACWILKFLTGPKTILKLRKEYLRVERGVILPVLGLGISSFVMLSTESLLSISFSSSLARYGGDIAVGAMTVITSVSQLCTLPIQGICQGGQPVMSFNFGAGKKARVKEAFRFQLTLCFGYTTLFWLLMMAVPGVVAGIFTSDAALIDYTTWAMRIYMAGILAMGVQIACQQSFMALGQAKVSLLLACLRKIILLIPLIFILPHFVADRCFGVFLAEPVSALLAAPITAITFFSRFDKILDRGAGRA